VDGFDGLLRDALIVVALMTLPVLLVAIGVFVIVCGRFVASRSTRRRARSR
jgi:hypothetical protein